VTAHEPATAAGRCQDRTQEREEFDMRGKKSCNEIQDDIPITKKIMGRKSVGRKRMAKHKAEMELRQKRTTEMQKN